MKEVSTIAVRQGGKLLLGRRRDNGKWTTPGGHLDPGEKPLAGAVRELLEETGLKVKASQLKPLESREVKPGLLVHGFLYEPSGKVKTTMADDPDLEVKRWHFVDPAAIEDKDLHVPRKNNVLLPLMEKSAMNHFWNGFEKRAASLADLRKFTGNKISKRVKAEFMFDTPKLLGFTQGMGKMPFKELKKQKTYVASIAKKIPKGDENMLAIGPAVDATQKGQPILARGSIVDKPFAKPLLQAVHEEKLKPREKEFMNRAVMAHELDEKKMMRKMKLTPQKVQNSTPNEFQAKTFNTHMSPGVILREGNLLATAPKNYSQPTKKFLQRLRQMDDTQAEIRGVIPEYVHGETRLSRHAIKHVEDGIKRKRAAV